MNIDLHCHSSISDGSMTPANLVKRAKLNGVDVLALTDHDHLGGISLARKVADEINLLFVSGVEISVTWSGETVHIIGLCIDENNKTLQSGLESVRIGRIDRAKEIAAQLSDCGIENSFEGAKRFATNHELIGRTHFARFLVDKGICLTLHDVFKKYLVKGKPGYVPHEWADLDSAIWWIKEAGGIAVIAHPGRYSFNEAVFDVFVSKFKKLGGEGIEVVTGSHNDYQFHKYALYAKKNKLLASRGSDFHNITESKYDLGMIPNLPNNLLPIWHNWEILS